MSNDREAGLGLHVRDWHLTEIDDLLEGIVSWCRSVLGQTRRPLGIDAFDFALAWTHRGEVLSARFLRLRPADLYNDAFAFELRNLLAPSAPARVSAGLFSWGDAAHRALPEHV